MNNEQWRMEVGRKHEDRRKKPEQITKNQKPRASTPHIEVINKIREYLRAVESVEFTILFGSVAEGKFSAMSDIDLGVYTEKEYSLLEIGYLIARLEQLSGRNVDLVVLNELHKKDPLLAYDIVTKGKLLVCRNETEFINFKRETFLYYFDSAPLRESVRERFLARLRSNNFGRRNYAGAA